MSCDPVFIGEFPKFSISIALAALETLLQEHDDVCIANVVTLDSQERMKAIGSLNAIGHALYNVNMRVCTPEPKLAKYGQYIVFDKESLDNLDSAERSFCEKHNVPHTESIHRHFMELTILRSMKVTHVITIKQPSIPGVVSFSTIVKEILDDAVIIEI